MAKSDTDIAILAQTVKSELFDDGIRLSGGDVIGIDRELGLMVLAEGASEGKASPAYQAVEILLDDMRVNLDETQGKGQGGSRAKRCLVESLENINEYFFARNENESGDDLHAGIALAVLMIDGSQMSYFALGPFHCFRQSAEFSHWDSSAGIHELLGEGRAIQPKILEASLSLDDMLMIVTSRFLDSVSIEFIQQTLARFGDNLEMAFRQLDARARRGGGDNTPTIILCHAHTPKSDPLGWLKKIGIR